MDVLKEILNRVDNLEKMQNDLLEKISNVIEQQKNLDKRIGMLKNTKGRSRDYLKLKKEVSYIWEDIKRLDDKIRKQGDGSFASLLPNTTTAEAARVL